MAILNICGTEVDTDVYPYIVIAEKHSDDGTLEGKVLAMKASHSECLAVAKAMASLPENQPYGVSVVPTTSMKALSLGEKHNGVF